MKIKLMVLDKDTRFLKLFLSMIETHYADKFFVYIFTNKESALFHVQMNKIDIVLASPVFEIDPQTLPKWVAFAYLGEDPNTQTHNGYSVYYKYMTPSSAFVFLRNMYCEKGYSESSFKPQEIACDDSLERKWASKVNPKTALDTIKHQFFPAKEVFRMPSMGDLLANTEDLRPDWDVTERHFDPQVKNRPDISEVQFRCAAPMVIKPGKYFIAKIMMFREDDTERADREAALLDEKVRQASSDVLEASKGQEFTIRLQSPDLPELDEQQQIRWNGKYAFKDFQILLPQDYDQDQLRLLGRVYSRNIPLTDISLILEVCCPVSQEVSCEKLHLRTAFVSYASKDRAEVVKRLQLLDTLRPDMQVFMDQISLRRGEEYEPRLYQEIRDRDLFFLFWSRNAAASAWVAKELEYALKHKPATRIEPYCLERLEDCPPPEALNHLHLWDWTMYYL